MSDIKKTQKTVSGISELESMDLGTLDENADSPVKERLADVNMAIQLFGRIKKDDQTRSINRARRDAMFDNEAPYNQAQLKATGQEDKTNLNFGEAQRQLDIALSSYVDLYSSVENLVSVKSKLRDVPNVNERQLIVNEELSTLLRSSPTFHSNFLMTCTGLIKHGVSPTYFDGPEEWMFQTCQLDDFLFPSDTDAHAEALDIVVIRRSYPVHKIMAWIDKEEAASTVGWDVEEVKRVVVNNVSTDVGTESGEEVGYQKIQERIKNNDVSYGYTNPSVKLLHFLVKEMDGRISHYICSESAPKSYMYRKLGRYNNAAEAFTIFTFGVGNNGKFHGIRGLGHRIFAHVQVSNRLRCQMVDGATLSASVMLQPENERAIEELEFTYYGAYSVISPHVKVIEKAIPDLGRSVVPAIKDMQDQLEANTETISTYGREGSSPYRNKMQTTSDMDVATRISGSSINLFYVNWERLLREVIRRILAGKKKDTLIQAFLDRCKERGVDEAFLKSIDTSLTKITRAVGGGSAANRSVILSDLRSMAGDFDEVGRKNLTRDIVAARGGLEAADRYAPKVEGERLTSDDKIIFFENQQLQQGSPIPVFPLELHGKHIMSHAEPLNQILSALDTGEADPVQMLEPLQAFYQHIGEHVNAAISAVGLEGVVGQAKQLLQIAEEAINNTQQHVQRLEREAATNPQEGGEPNQANQERLEKHQLEMQITKERADLKQEIEMSNFKQKAAIKDAETAMNLQNQQP